MNRKKKSYPLIEGLKITTLAAEGKAMGKHNDLVVFVPNTVPGDVVDVQIRSKRRRFMEGFVVRYAEYSSMRAEPFCDHFGTCGGCKWQNLPYAEQLNFKRGQVQDQLVRIGKIAVPDIAETLASEKTTFYRNKLEFTFSPKRWMTREEIDAGETITDPQALGFHIPGMFDKIMNVEKCWLQDAPSNEVRNWLRDYCIEKRIQFYDQRTHQGMMRNLIIRTSSTGDVMVIVVFAYDDIEIIGDVMGSLQEAFPSLTSLMYIVNSKLNDSISDQEVVSFAGTDHIFEQMEGLRFKIGPKSFYQTNSQQAYNLYKVTREFAELNGDEIVYDLYTGTGTIANFVARQCRKVVGVEYVPEAIDDARINSEINGISNTVFFAGDMKDVINNSFIEANGRPDVVILDPPRAGVHEDVINTILQACPEKIIYVSCNPASQARDLALLDQAYFVDKVQPVDMFPHTHHVENVVRLIRR